MSEESVPTAGVTPDQEEQEVHADAPADVEDDNGEDQDEGK